jgi:ribosomal-protein-alanine N-acetyltransferase
MESGLHPLSARLGYRRPVASDAGVLHAIITDDHVKRYLCDGQTLPLAWAVEAIEASDRLFEARGVGLWLVFEPAAGAPIGFCGFVTFEGFEAFGGEPQLIYALREAGAGKGYATEAAEASIRYAREHAGFTEIVAAVDEPNGASIRVLEKLGFARCGEVPGAFGAMLLFRLAGR